MHKHARLTPKARLQAGLHQIDVAQAMGVSLTTLKKWLRRFREECLAGLQDRSSRPRCSPRALRPGLRQRIIALRQQRRTARLIVRQLGVSAASVSRVLRRAGLSRWRDLQPAVPVVRYQREHPGELIHLDVKKLGRIKGIGHRITADRRSQHRSRGIGWDYVHVAIDDASRLAVAHVAEDEKGDTATALLIRTVEHYRQRGIRVQRVMTDNGSPYVFKAFRAACAQLRIRHLRTKPLPHAPTARPSASSRRHCASGPMPQPKKAPNAEPRPCTAGSTTTTGTGPTRRYNPIHPSALCAFGETTS